VGRQITDYSSNKWQKFELCLTEKERVKIKRRIGVPNQLEMMRIGKS
jgi:hypothetical protein